MSERSSGLVVDIEAVRAFGKSLRHDLDAHLSAENDQILVTLLNTPIFGEQCPSDVIVSAAKAYGQQLIKLLGVVDALLYNGAVLTELVQKVADSYEEADDVSADRVLELLASAKSAVNHDIDAKRVADAMMPHPGRVA
ncbi:hypothetical protein [Dactylosporangium matsuzakiense]|uniref:Uncharacterized protein n=1 Tax=Dactylosporangium matsuzakiense TaxID=53360 RepID=A0A9W6KFT2_9ACTN|nr:hypothetical protein [Dactylosporangium matsuzakiense]UWZ46580.1 hypothetical protein Dmats_09230 [Dactylosporangium matsuzakiense]GLL01292.1 hypothetical protein GCM10017581_030330 [Dactylosporangium matsuzakiense]